MHYYKNSWYFFNIYNKYYVILRYFIQIKWHTIWNYLKLYVCKIISSEKKKKKVLPEGVWPLFLSGFLGSFLEEDGVVGGLSNSWSSILALLT